MKKTYLYISILLFSLLASCNNDTTKVTDEFFINDTCIITGKVRGDNGALILVIKRLKDTTDVAFIKQYDIQTNVPFERLFIFSKLNDTLHFDYIGKYRFFKK